MSELTFNMNTTMVGKSAKFSFQTQFQKDYPFFFEEIRFVNGKHDVPQFITNLTETFPGMLISDFSKSLGTRIFQHPSFVVILLDRKEIEVVLFLKEYNEDTAKLSGLLEPFVDNKNDEKLPITYYFSDGKGITQQVITTKMSDLLNVDADLYPNINIEKLAEFFVKSKENILILIGPAGTGKTTLLKYILAKSSELNRNANTNVYCKDEVLLRSDSFWVGMLKNEVDFLLLDDIDNILYPRDTSKDGNPFVSQLLSFSNGVFPNSTKIIITTNKKMEDIDSALLRPGRCFDVLNVELLPTDMAREICVKNYGIAEDTIDFLGESTIQQSDLMMKIAEKLDNVQKNYIFSEGTSQKDAYIKGKMKRRAGFSVSD